MKGIYFPIIILTVWLFIPVVATAQCSADTSITTPGVYQNGDYCFPQNVWNQQVWQFRNYDSVMVSGFKLRVDSLRIETIYNLPCGMNWVPDKPVYYNQDNGCITLWGATSDSDSLAINSYILDIGFSAYVSPYFDTGAITLRLSALSGNIYVSVVQSGSPCVAPDTSSLHDTIGGCGATIQDTGYTGIEQVISPAGSLTNYPDPFSGNTQIVYSTTENGKVVFSVHDLAGKTLHEEMVNIVPGRNIINFNRKNISAGIYFYSISSGRQTITNKMVITD